MGSKRWIGWICWRCGCGTVHCLNICLATLAVLWTGLIVLNSLKQEVPLPELVARWTTQTFGGKAYITSWNRAVFDLKGGLYLEDFTLTRRVSGDRVLEAQSVYVNLAILHMAFGVFPPLTDLQASDIRLYVDASRSSSGLNEPVAMVDRIHLREDSGSLVIEDLLLRAGGIQIYATGSAQVEDLRLAMRSRSPGTNRLQDWLERLQRMPSDLNANILIHWSMQPNGDHRLQTRLIADQLSLNPAELEQVDSEAIISFGRKPPTISAVSGEAKLVGLQKDALPESIRRMEIQWPIGFRFGGSGSLAQFGSYRLPAQLRIVIDNNPVPWLPDSKLILSTDLAEKQKPIQWILTGKQIFAEGNFRSPWTDKKEGDHSPASPLLSLRAILQKPVLKHLYPDTPDIRLLKGTQAGYLRFNGIWSEEHPGIQGNVTADALYIGETHFDHVHTGLTIQASHFQIANAFVRKSRDEFATGSYYQHFPSSDFSLNATGSIFPSALDGILGQWWMRIFTHIEAPEPLPGDVTVWGHWRRANAIQASVGAIGDGAYYRGIRAPYLRVGVRRNENWAQVHRLEAKFPEGGISGMLAWQQNLPDDVPQPMLLDFKTDVDWKTVQQASALEPLAGIHIDGNPKASARGVLWSPPREEQTGNDTMIPDLRFNLVSRNGRCEVTGLGLNRVHATGTAVGDVVHLNSVSGEFAEGVFTGTVEIRNWMSEIDRTQHLQLQVFDASYEKAITQLSGLMKSPETLQVSFSRGDPVGRADSEVDLLIASSPEQTRGRGRIIVRDVPVGQIHILGGLSRTLNSMGLGFSTLDLDAASIEWQLAEQVIEIPTCLITGPVLNLDVTGSIDLATRNLNLQADAYFFRGLISKVLTPVTDNLLFDVTGQIEDPVWRLRLNPFRWFQNRMPKEPTLE